MTAGGTGATLVLPRSVDLQRRDRVGSSGDRLNKMCDVLLEARDSQLRLDRTFRQRGQRDGSPTVGAAAERATGDVRSVRASAEIHNEVHLEGRGGEGRGGTSAVAAVSGALAVAQVARLLSPCSSDSGTQWRAPDINSVLTKLPEESRRGLIGRPEGRPRLERVLKDVLNARDGDALLPAAQFYPNFARRLETAVAHLKRGSSSAR